jgi:hypothetical protein
MNGTRGSRLVEVEWSGVEWSGVEWSGVEWSGVEWSGSIRIAYLYKCIEGGHFSPDSCHSLLKRKNKVCTA